MLKKRDAWPLITDWERRGTLTEREKFCRLWKREREHTLLQLSCFSSSLSFSFSFFLSFSPIHNLFSPGCLTTKKRGLFGESALHCLFCQSHMLPHSRFPFSSLRYLFTREEKERRKREREGEGGKTERERERETWLKSSLSLLFPLWSGISPVSHWDLGMNFKRKEWWKNFSE